MNSLTFGDAEHPRKCRVMSANTITNTNTNTNINTNININDKVADANNYLASLFLSCKSRSHSCSIFSAIFTLDSRLVINDDD